MDAKSLAKDQKFEYILNEQTYLDEASLQASDKKCCSPEGHDWKKSFVYGKYTCKNCDAVRMKIK